MKIIIIGFGVQGRKRAIVAGRNCVAIVDPYEKNANFKSIFDVPLNLFDAAMVCTPDSEKNRIIIYLLENKKHVLVEKPLLDCKNIKISEIAKLSKSKETTCYTAYNHRFEPHFVNFKKILEKEKIGKPYFLRLFYGNGTARLVRESKWRDKEGGVINDLGSHILDTYLFWFGKNTTNFNLFMDNKFENKSHDHILFGSNGLPKISAEISMISWRNHFFADFYFENGSLHIDSLCKWGPSKLILRKRILPSGKPTETKKVIVKNDPTWDKEYIYFKKLCKLKVSNTENDIWIQKNLRKLSSELKKK